jgi:hypothetical protein
MHARPVSNAPATDSARTRLDCFGVIDTTRGPVGPGLQNLAEDRQRRPQLVVSSRLLIARSCQRLVGASGPSHAVEQRGRRARRQRGGLAVQHRPRVGDEVRMPRLCSCTIRDAACLIHAKHALRAHCAWDS